MKKIEYCLLYFTLLLAGCNKDDEIIGDFPSDDNPSSLEYKVLEYTPAPGQYINETVSGFNNISSPEEACLQAEKRLSEEKYVSLGSWGGYIVVKFNKSINNSGGYDFAITTNSFDSSSEPGIVWVMQDKNGNGKPDDNWYELKGSHFGKEGYERNYWVRYSRPDAKGNTPWEDSNGESGFITWLGNFHSQDFYYPSWVKENNYTLHGSRLPLQAIQNEQTGNWTNLPFEWGYADNFGDDFNAGNHQNYFKISDAVDDKNNDINLPSIDFIKVQTAINGSAGWLGENSTEVCGFRAL